MSPARTVESGGPRAAQTAGDLTESRGRGIDMPKVSESSGAEVQYLAETAYERFWTTNALAVAAHDAGDWSEARRLNGAASAWLDRQSNLSNGDES